MPAPVISISLTASSIAKLGGRARSLVNGESVLGFFRGSFENPGIRNRCC